jgi:hypothetical protein
MQVSETNTNMLLRGSSSASASRRRYAATRDGWANSARILHAFEEGWDNFEQKCRDSRELLRLVFSGC